MIFYVGAFGSPILQLLHENLRQETMEKGEATNESAPHKKKERVNFQMSMEDKEVRIVAL